MSSFISKHANKRGKSRNIGTAKMKRLMSSSSAKYMGGNKYKVTKKIGGCEVTVIFRKKDGRRTAITGWKS